MRVFPFVFEAEDLILYALRSKEKLIFLNLARNFQNQDLELTQILNLSIKKLSCYMFISNLCYKTLHLLNHWLDAFISPEPRPN